LSSLARLLLKERCDDWVSQLAGEKCSNVAAAVLAVLADWYGCGQRLGACAQNQLMDLAKNSLKCEGHQVRYLAKLSVSFL
jgi:hypothetical protein